MILYNVTIKIDLSVEQEWLEWMLEKHIPDVLATGLFLDNKVCRLMENHEAGLATYSMHYYLKDLETYQVYQSQYAPALQQDFIQRYQGKFLANRSVSMVIGSSVQ